SWSPGAPGRARARPTGATCLRAIGRQAPVGDVVFGREGRAQTGAQMKVDGAYSNPQSQRLLRQPAERDYICTRVHSRATRSGKPVKPKLTRTSALPAWLAGPSLPTEPRPKEPLSSRPSKSTS